jgi:hypothetical protein
MSIDPLDNKLHDLTVDYAQKVLTSQDWVKQDIWDHIDAMKQAFKDAGSVDRSQPLNSERNGLMYGQLQMLEVLYMSGVISDIEYKMYSNPLMLAKNHRRRVKNWPFNDRLLSFPDKEQT